MRIGFCGAHRVGKTTLAKRVADELGYTFIDGSCTGVFEKLGLAANQPLNFKERLSVQIEIFDRYLDNVSGATNFVTDRTPFDYFGYTMAELNTMAVSGENAHIVEQAVETYFGACGIALNKTIDLMFLVSPGIPIVNVEGKGIISKPYIDHVGYLIEAIAHDVDRHHFGSTIPVPKPYIDLDVRTKFCMQAINLVSQSAKERETSPHLN